jgi:hypothetical protein
MNRTAKLVCVAFGLVLPTAASAGELAPLQAGTFSLREQIASVYYTVQGESFEVVATIASSDGQNEPVRYVTQLAPGQVATLSVGAFGTGTPATVLKLERSGDMLHAEIVPNEVIAAR